MSRPPFKPDGHHVEPSALPDWTTLTAARCQLVDSRLHAVVAAAARELSAVDRSFEVIGQELRTFVATGKRLRPLLVMLGHQLVGGNADDVLGPAVAVELVHTWALLHDDVIDSSDTRRGRVTMHRLFAGAHRKDGWAGDADGYGVAVAVLLGDLVAVIADDEFEEATVDPAAHAAGRAVFSRLRREVMAGQLLDVTTAAEAISDRDRALKVATLKSGRYTFTRPLEIGAVLGGATSAVVTRLGRAGDALGVAFQLTDDLLGITGDQRVTGKPVGGDLREGKRTLLVAEAMQRLDPDAATRLERALGDRNLADTDMSDLIASMQDCGAVTAVRHRVQALLATARDELMPFGQPEPVIAILALADNLATRDR